MNTFRFSKLLLVAAPLLFSAQLYSANPEPVVVEVEFVTPITIVEDNTLKFGLISTAIVNTNVITIATNDGVTDATSRVVGGTQEAGQVTIGANVGTAATLTVAETPATSTSYDLTAFDCSYDSGGTPVNGDCGAGLAVTTVASAVTLIGATLTANASPPAGSDDTTIEITMTYD